MIRVVNLSPAIDVTYQLPKLELGEALRVAAVHRVPGGKGVNVARVIHAGKFETELVLPLGGMAGQWIESELVKLAIPVQKISIAQETRSCVTVVAEEVTVLNEPASEISEVEFEELIAAIGGKASVSVVSGSMPKNLSEQQLAKLFATLRASSDVLIIDTSNAALLIAAKAEPDLLKPNREEALAATGQSDVAGAVSELLKIGAKAVLLSDGEGYATLARTEKTLKAKPPRFSGNPTGAGDAMVALAAISIEQAKSDKELLAAAVAAGALAVKEPVAGQIDWSKLAQLAASIVVEE